MESSLLLPLSGGTLFVKDIDEDMSNQSAHTSVLPQGRTDTDMSTDQTSTSGVVSSELISI